METMLESEAMAILVGAGVSYGRREAALRAAGGALAILEEPEAYAAQLQARGVALVRRAWTVGRACSTSWTARGWRLFRAGTNIIRRCFGTLRTAAPALCLWARRI